MLGAGKAALEHLVRTWALEIGATPARANLIDPGPVGTRLRTQALPGIDPKSWPAPESVAPAIAALCLPSETRNGAVVDATSPG